MRSFFICIISCLFMMPCTAKTFNPKLYYQLPCDKGLCKMVSGLIYVIQKESILLNYAFGYADYLHKIPFNTKTQIYIGSLKKQFIAAAILKLVNEGKLCLDDPVAKYIEFNTTLAAKDPTWIRTTTLHHLLCHTSGVTDETVQPMNAADPESYIDRIYCKATSPSPYNEVVYSSAGYGLLERIIHTVSGLSAPEYIKIHFLTPLHMNDTLFHGSDIPFRIRQHHAQKLCYPYTLYDEDQLKSAYDPFKPRHFGSSAMISTAHDLYKWNQGLHSGTIFKTTPKQSKKMLELMRKFYAIDPEDPGNYYGYGLIGHFREHTPIYWHVGLTTGSSVYLEYNPVSETHIVILCNHPDLDFNANTGKYILDNLSKFKDFSE